MQLLPESTNLSTLHPGTLTWEELDLLSELVWAYEQCHHAITLLNSKLESGELNINQLKEVLPNRSTRFRVLNKKRRISMKAALEMVDREWVPVESFFQTSYWSSFERQRFIRKYSFLLSSAI